MILHRKGDLDDRVDVVFFCLGAPTKRECRTMWEVSWSVYLSFRSLLRLCSPVRGTLVRVTVPQSCATVLPRLRRGPTSVAWGGDGTGFE